MWHERSDKMDRITKNERLCAIKYKTADDRTLVSVSPNIVAHVKDPRPTCR